MFVQNASVIVAVGDEVKKNKKLSRLSELTKDADLYKNEYAKQLSDTRTLRT